MGMSDMDMEEGESEAPLMEVDGLDIPQEFVGDLGDLGLIEMGEIAEDEVDADEELAVAALALAANALKMLKAESEDELLNVSYLPEDMPEDEPESSQEEDESKEAEEHKSTKRGEQLHGSRRQAAATKQNDDAVRKLREISARLSSVRAPVKPVAKPVTKTQAAAKPAPRGMLEALAPLARRAPTRAR
jgi:hypothetical protein